MKNKAQGRTETKCIAHPKPKDQRKSSTPVVVLSDGREIVDYRTTAGEREYRRRLGEMIARQGGLCCLCGRWMEGSATFEHVDNRGMGGGHRDDRIMKNGQPYNGAAHWWCNAEKGSKRVPYKVP